MKKIFVSALLLCLYIPIWAQLSQPEFSPRSLISKPAFSANKLKSDYNGSIVLAEKFDGSAFIPQGWSDTVTSHYYSWRQLKLDQVPFSQIDATDQFSAVCPWSRTVQNEWMLSPEINLSSVQHVKLLFYAGYSRYWLDSADLKLYVKVKNQNTPVLIWDAKTDTSKTKSWAWRKVSIDLPQFIGNTIQLAWQYKGKDGDLVALDGIVLRAGAMNTETDILSFKLANQTKVETIDKLNHKVEIEVPGGTDLTNLLPTIEISTGATIKPNSGQTQAINLGDTLFYFVKAADPAIAVQKWSVVVGLSFIPKEADILSFSVPNQTQKAIINLNDHTISIEVAFGTDLTKIIPAITVSTGATVLPASSQMQSFVVGQPITYIVSPQDPKVAAINWKVTIKVRDYENDILSFSLPAQLYTAEFDKVNKLIKIEVAADVNLSKMTPTFNISPGATSNPISGSVLAFKDADTTYFQISAANAKIKPATWKVVVFKSISSFFIEDFDLLKIPDNWTVETFNPDATWTVKDQYHLPFSTVYYRSKSSALCPWSKTAQNEKLISPTIQIPNNTGVFLHFYAGYNPFWLDSASVQLQIKQSTETTWTKIWEPKITTPIIKSWKWKKDSVNLTNYRNTLVQLAWVYTGRNGDLIGFDRVFITNNAQKSKPIVENNFEGLSITTFPNPASDYFVIRGISQCDFELFSLEGKSMLKKLAYFENEMVSLRALKSGVYILKISNNNASVTYKLVITK